MKYALLAFCAALLLFSCTACSFLARGEQIVSVTVTGGCSGNLQGISRLLAGMDVDEAISRMEGIRCGVKPTSCPDQLSRALKKLKKAQADA